MKLARTATIQALAEQAGVARMTMRRRLLALHAAHGGDWLVRCGRAWRVNLEALRAAHPALFVPASLPERVSELEERVTDLEREARASAEAIGQLNRRIGA